MRSPLVVAALAVLALACAGPRGPRVLEGVAIPVHEGYVIASDSTRLFYRVVGSGPDTIVAVHGGPGLHSGAFVSFEPLAAGGTVIFYDQRGGGQSSLPQYPQQLTAELHVSDLGVVLDHFGIQQATLLAHSWGALLAGLYASSHPGRVRRLILVAPMPVRAEPHLYTYAAALPALLGEDSNRYMALSRSWDTTSAPHRTCRELVPLVMRAGGTQDTSAVARVTGGICSSVIPVEAMRRSWTRTPEWTLGSLGRWDFRELFSRVNVEALVMGGERDAIPIAATQEWVTVLRRAGLSVFAGAGHFLYAEDPEAFSQAVREFLGRD
jgi:proline iminopeptidase